MPLPQNGSNANQAAEGFYVDLRTGLTQPRHKTFGFDEDAFLASFNDSNVWNVTAGSVSDLQSKINTAKGTSGGGIVQLPAGTWTLTNDRISWNDSANPVILQGDSTGGTIITLGSGYSGGSPAFYPRRSRHLVLRDLTIDGASRGTTNLLQFSSVFNVLLDRVRVVWAGGVGIKFTRSSQITIQNSESSHHGQNDIGHGLGIKETSDAEGSYSVTHSTDVAVLGTILDDNGNHGGSNNNGNGFDCHARNVEVAGCLLRNNTYATKQPDCDEGFWHNSRLSGSSRATRVYRVDFPSFVPQRVFYYDNDIADITGNVFYPDGTSTCWAAYNTIANVNNLVKIGTNGTNTCYTASTETDMIADGATADATLTAEIDALRGGDTPPPPSTPGEGWAVIASADDAEEDDGGTQDTAIASGDLDIGEAGVGTAIGVRFQNVDIPQAATINDAYIEFEANGNTSDSTSGDIWGEDADDAAAYTAGSANSNISGRTKTTASAAWSNVETWEDGNIYQTPDLTAIVQEIVNRGSWASGNAMAFILEMSGHRRAMSYDGDPTGAPRLVVDYETATTIDQYIAAGADDAEEASDTTMEITGNDLDLNQTTPATYVGLWFDGVSVAQGATITAGHIGFTARGDSSDGTPDMTIDAEDSDDAPAITSTNADISGRTGTTASVTWSSIPSWSDEVAYQTDDISSVIQEIVDRGGWASGNAMLFRFYRDGSGDKRVAWSVEGADGNSKPSTYYPKLHIEVAAESGDDLSKVIAETEAATEASQRSIGYRRLLAETVALASAVLSLFSMRRIVGETEATTESIARASSLLRLAGDTVALSAAFVRQLYLGIKKPTGDTVAASDSVVYVFSFRRLIAETAALVELILRPGEFVKHIGETVAVVRGRIAAIGYGKITGDTVAIPDALVTVAVWLRMIAEATGPTEAITRARAVIRRTGETMAIASAILRLRPLRRLIAETAALVEAVDMSYALRLIINEAVAVSTTALRIIGIVRVVAGVVAVTTFGVFSNLRAFAINVKRTTVRFLR